MKSIWRTLFFCLIMWFTLSACSKEHIGPEVATELPTIALHGFDDPWCGPVSVYNLVDDAGSPSPGLNQVYGELTVANHADSIRFLLVLEVGWFVDKIGIFVGNSSDIPRTQNGLINTIAFPVHHDPGPYLNSCITSVAVSTHSAQCYDVVYWCEVLELSFFTGPVQSSRRNLWAKQVPFANGFMVDYCYRECVNTRG